MDISNQSIIFNQITSTYLISTNSPVVAGWGSPVTLVVEYNFDEILDVAKHHAECGENVFLIAFPKFVSIGERPNTLFFFETFEEMIDVTETDTGLVIILKEYESGFAFFSVIDHLSKNFKSCPLIMLRQLPAHYK